MDEMTGKQIREFFEDCKTRHIKNEPLWRDISRISGITMDFQLSDGIDQSKEGKTLDADVEDPTAALSVFQAGDYAYGIIWGTGENAVMLEPSDFVAERTDAEQIKEYYEFRSKQLLKNINSPDSGFCTAVKPALTDICSFGTGGVGCYKNSRFPIAEENPTFFRNHRINNCVIAAGKNNRVDAVFCVHRWTVNRIIEEFSMLMKQEDLPKQIQEDIKSGKLTQQHTLIQAIIPRRNFIMGKKGKIGNRYRSCWLTPVENKDEIFYEEGFRRFPIGMCRAIVVGNEEYGRSYGTMLLSSMRAVNHMLSEGILSIEKLNDPALGTFGNALFGDSVLNSSPGSLTVFSQELLGNSREPVFKIGDVGDPSALIQFLIPYLNDKIATGFKTDKMLDFSAESARQQTATEVMQKSVIRAKSIAGFLIQITSELLDVVIDRQIQIEDDLDLAGINPKRQKEEFEKAKQANRSDKVIPDAVLEAMEKGVKWYKIRYNNELVRIVKTESIEKIIQAVNAVTMIIQLYPDIQHAVKWYELWKDVNEHLGINYIVNEEEFKNIVLQNAQQQQQAMMLQAGQMGADVVSKTAKAEKDKSEADNVGKK